MRVLAIDVVDVPPTRDVEYVGQPEDLDRLLPEADVVFVSVPFTKATQGMIGPKQFELMKKGAYLINVGRGGVVDTPALTAALQSGKLAAAGLDVVEPEPLPADHPLWSMQNVTISPHAAGQMDGLRARQIELYRDNIERYLTGKPMRNLVDKQKGF
jgi:phosphoglycerate dehydrogenase-like enzyme